MANFSRSELTRRKARLERRLEFLQDRLERNGLADGSHDSAECSALQTAHLHAAVLLRARARAPVAAPDDVPDRAAVAEHRAVGAEPRTRAAVLMLARLPCAGIDPLKLLIEQHVPPTAGDLRPPKVPPPLALALFSVPGVRAWDLHWTNGGCDVRVFVDAQADGLAVAKALHGALESTMATRGEIEITITDACDRPRLVRFTQLREPWTFRHPPQEVTP